MITAIFVIVEVFILLKNSLYYYYVFIRIHSPHFHSFFILNYLNTKSLQQYKVTKEKSLITIIHYNIYIFTVYLSKTYYEAAALPGSRVFVLFQLLK